MNIIITRKNARHAQPGSGGNESGVPGEPDKAAGDALRELPDGTLDRLLKLIPAEVIAGYTALLSITASVDQHHIEYAAPTAIVACSVLIVLVLRRLGRQHLPPIAPPRLQYVFSIVAFWVWAIAIRDPLDHFGYAIPAWIPAFGIVLVPLFGSLLIDLTDDKPGES